MFREICNMTQMEFDALIQDTTKQIAEDIAWSEDEDHSPTVEFRVEVESEPGYPIFIRGSYNVLAASLSFALIHRGSGRIYALDMGKEHHNPSCENVGEVHKHRWTDLFADKEAYVPQLTAPVSQPIEVWKEFCNEAKIKHEGVMHPLPPIQLFL